MTKFEDHPEKTISIFKKQIKQSDLIKLVGLLAFIALISVVVVLAWPTLSLVFEPGGVDQLIEIITNQGPLGVLILLGMQLLQIIVAFIPGVVAQIELVYPKAPQKNSEQARCYMVFCVWQSSTLVRLTCRDE